jgi:hypothetical protein
MGSGGFLGTRGAVQDSPVAASAAWMCLQAQARPDGDGDGNGDFPFRDGVLHCSTSRWE